MGEDYKLIELTRGLVTAVSVEDWEEVSKYTWQASIMNKNKTYETIVAVGSVKGKRVLLSRFLCKLGDGNIDKRLVDHHNRYPLDNRRCNLRICDKSKNGMNTIKRSGEYTSKYVGVCKDKRSGKWEASAKNNGYKVFIGFFDTEKEAAVARDKVAIKNYGEFAYLNFPIKPAVLPDPPEIIKMQIPQDREPNSPKQRSKIVHEYLGVFPRGKTFAWQVSVRKKKTNKGGYKTSLEAAKARDAFILAKGLTNRLSIEKGEKK